MARFLPDFEFALQQLAVSGQTTMAGVGGGEGGAVNATIGPFCPDNLPTIAQPQLGETHVIAKPSDAIICAVVC